MTQSRKAYWQAYAKRRYQERKATRLAEAESLRGGGPPEELCGPPETPAALFKRLCIERGLNGQANWRARAKFKQEFERSLGLHSMRHQHDFAEILLKKAAALARTSGREFSLTRADLIPLPALCPVLGAGLDYPSLLDGSHHYTPSVDRIDSTGGYVSGNVQVISWRANRLKNDATLPELIALGRWAAAQNRTCFGPREALYSGFQAPP